MRASTVLNGSRIVPVVVLDDASFAPDLADALTAGGIPCAEITLRTPRGPRRDPRGRRPARLRCRAGTVLTVAQVDAAVDAG
ncbi:keto-deoxy-phosphogluconate aldolase, partial [Microbacterium sp. SUBG005]